MPEKDINKNILSNPSLAGNVQEMPQQTQAPEVNLGLGFPQPQRKPQPAQQQMYTSVTPQQQQVKQQDQNVKQAQPSAPTTVPDQTQPKATVRPKVISKNQAKAINDQVQTAVKTGQPVDSNWLQNMVSQGIQTVQQLPQETTQLVDQATRQLQELNGVKTFDGLVNVLKNKTDQVNQLQNQTPAEIAMKYTSGAIKEDDLNNLKNTNPQLHQQAMDKINQTKKATELNKTLTGTKTTAQVKQIEKEVEDTYKMPEGMYNLVETRNKIFDNTQIQKYQDNISELEKQENQIAGDQDRLEKEIEAQYSNLPESVRRGIYADRAEELSQQMEEIQAKKNTAINEYKTYMSTKQDELGIYVEQNKLVKSIIDDTRDRNFKQSQFDRSKNQRTQEFNQSTNQREKTFQSNQREKTATGAFFNKLTKETIDPTKGKYYDMSPEQIQQQIKSDGNYVNQSRLQDIRTSTGGFSVDNVSNVLNAIPEGSTGGQCGTFVGNILRSGGIDITIPSPINEKFGLIDKSITTPQVGDVFFTDENKQYGHVGIVKAVLDDGSIVTAESNRPIKDAKGNRIGSDEKVHSRVIKAGDAKVQGFMRPSYGEKPTEAGKGGSVYDSLSTEDQEYVKSLANYDATLPSRTSKNFARYIAGAKEVNSNFSQSQYDVRKSFLTDRAKGDDSANIKSINTTLGHVSGLVDTMEALSNDPIKIKNEFTNWALNNIGDPRIVDFDTAKDAVASEMAKVFKGGKASPTEDEINSRKDVFSSANSPEQLKASISRSTHLLSSRLKSLSENYKRNMGTYPKESILFPESIKTLEKLGINAREFQGVEGQETTPTQLQEFTLFGGTTMQQPYNEIPISDFSFVK